MRRALAISGGVILAVALVVTVLALISTPPRITVYVINALDLEITATVGDADPIVLASGAWARIDRPLGDMDLLATATATDGTRGSHEAGGDPRVVERIRVSKMTDGVVVWSIAGAAPLYLHAGAAAGNTPPRLQAARETPVCQEFPRSIAVKFDPASTGSGASGELRLAEDCHWRHTLAVLMGAAQLQAAAILARSVWRAQPDNRSAIDASLHLTNVSEGPRTMLAFAAEMIASGHADAKARFDIQEVQMRTQPLTDVRAAARKEADSHPDSPIAQLLLARCERQSVALDLHAKLAEQFPDYLWRCRDYGWRLLVAGRYAAAAEEYDRYATIDPPGAGWLSTWHVTALLGAGRHADAVARLDSIGRDMKEHKAPNLDVAVLYAVLARRLPDSGIKSADEWMLRMFGPEPTADSPERATARNAEDWARFRIRTGRDTPGEFDVWPDGDLRTALRLMQAVRRSQASAPGLAAAAPSSVYAVINDDATLLLLAGLAAADTDASTAGRLLLAMRGVDSEQRTMLGAFIVGAVESGQLDEIGPDLQAVIALLRGLRAKQATDRRMWLQRAVSLDTPDGVARTVAERELR